MTQSARLTALLLTFILASCGWHLRGYEAGLDHIESVHIRSENVGVDLLDHLARRLAASNVTTTANATEARYSILLQDQDSRRRVASLSGSARVSEYRLTEEVDLVVFNAAGEQLLPRTTLSSEQVFEFDEDNVHARDDEEQRLKSEMHEALARQIIARLRIAASKSVSPATADATEG